MDHRHLLGLVAFLSVWFALAGGGGCSSSPPAACTAATGIAASSDDFDYNPVLSEWVDGWGIHWLPDYNAARTAIDELVIGLTSYSHKVCVRGGHVEGPMPANVVYECEEQHCPLGGCPDPCFSYHNVASDHPETGGDVMYDRIKRTNLGDAISQRVTGEGAHYGVHRSYFKDIHDDALECDWGCDASIADSLLEDVNTVVAMNPRDNPTDARDVTGYTVEVVDSLVKLKVFPATHEVVARGVGSLGLFKYAPDNCPATHVVTGSTFAVQKLQENDGLLFPPVTSGLTSEGNTLLWYGSTTDYEALLDDTGSASTRCDGLTNRERMEHLAGVADLGGGLPGFDTWTVVVKASSQGPNAFLAANWTPIADAWKDTHDADDQP